MLYNSNSRSECQDDRASGGSDAPKTNIHKNICCIGAQSELVMCQQQQSPGCTRQISQDSGNSSDCRTDSDAARPEAGELICYQPQTPRTTIQHDNAHCCGEDQARTTFKVTPNIVEPINRELIHSKSMSSHTTTSIEQQNQRHQRPTPKMAHHRSASQIRCSIGGQPTHSSPQNCPDNSVCCLVVKPEMVSCCVAPTQTSMSGLQDGNGNGKGGGDLPEDDTCNPEEFEEPLDYKPILAKILNEKKLALISSPEVIAFLNARKPASDTLPSAHSGTHM